MEAASTTSTESANQTTARSLGFPLKISIPRSKLIFAALLLFAASSTTAFFQPLCPDPYRRSGLAAVIYPAEENAHKRLPAFTCDLNAVAVVPETGRVWVVGDRGLVAYSDDGGREWKRRSVPAPDLPPPSVLPPTSVRSPGNQKPFQPAAAAKPSRGTSKGASSKSSVLKSSAERTTPSQSSEQKVSSYDSSAERLHGPNADADESSKKASPQQSSSQQPSPPQASPQQRPASLDDKKSSGSTDPTQQQVVPEKKPGVEKGMGGAIKRIFGKKKSDAGTAANSNVAVRKPSQVNPGSKSSSVRTPTTQPSTPANDAGDQASPGQTDQDSLPQENLIAVGFSDNLRGSILGHEGTLYTTSDGGESWSQRRIDGKFVSAQISDNGKVIWGVIDGVGRSFVLEIQAGFREGMRVIGSFPNEAANGSGSFAGDAGAVNANDGKRWVATAGSRILRSDGSAGWEQVWPQKDRGDESRSARGSDAELRGLYFINSNHGWVTGAQGTILATSDGGDTWKQQASYTSSFLRAVTFAPDGASGWAAGTDGTILSTKDGGLTWLHSTQGTEAKVLAGTGEHRRSLPPWYYGALALTLAAIGLAALSPARRIASKEESVADTPSSDKPLELGDPDALDLTSIALGLSKFLRNQNTMPPLTIAITGDWGTGKSSLMNLLRADLRKYKFRPVWFNAWHHQHEQNLLAALLQSIKTQAIPRWYFPRGFAFRLHLMAIRTRKHLVPVLALLLLFSVMMGYELNHHDHVIDIDTLAKFLVPSDFPTLLENLRRLMTDTSRLGFIATLAGLAGTLWKGVTAFGVKPGSLLTGISGKVKVADLEAKTSFRQKFATEFSEVTRALGVRTMPIFIDDLDRCRPEHALEILEAVNFLVSSGECFVVMGLARRQVEACVAISFKDVAQEIGAFALADEKDDGSDKQDVSDKDERARKRRAEFARQYLDKLINIEVPVPAPTEEQCRQLLMEEGRHWIRPPERSWDRVVSAFERLRPAIAVTLIVLGLAGAGYLGGKRLQFSRSAPPAADIAEQQEQGDVSSAAPSSSAPAQDAQEPVVGGPQTAAAPVPPPVVEAPRIVPLTSNSLSWGYWVAFPLSLAMLWLWFYFSLFRPDPVVRDSTTFKDALRIWHPVVYAGQPTPRSIKRFMNRVRFLAMRQRANREGPDRQDGRKSIPESVLVALAAMQHFKASLIEDETKFETVCNAGRPQAVDNSLGSEMLGKAVAGHLAKFGDWDEIKNHRLAYLQISSTVRVR